MTSPRPSLAASPEADSLRLELIDRARGNRASWRVIGLTLGMSGPEAKRHAKKLRERVKRAMVAEAVKPAATEEAEWVS